MLRISLIQTVDLSLLLYPHISVHQDELTDRLQKKKSQESMRNIQTETMHKKKIIVTEQHYSVCIIRWQYCCRRVRVSHNKTLVLRGRAWSSWLPGRWRGPSWWHCRTERNQLPRCFFQAAEHPSHTAHHLWSVEHITKSLRHCRSQYDYQQYTQGWCRHMRPFNEFRAQAPLDLHS